MPLLLALLILPLVLVVLIPVGLIQRIRRGGMRRRARPSVITLNAVAVMLSTIFFLLGALITGQWIPTVLSYALAGLGVGAALGTIGLGLTRWEHGRGPIYYTPNQWVVLAVTTVVGGRMLYGLWHAWVALRNGIDQGAALAASGVPLTMAAGAMVLGYYLIYWIGVRRRLRAV